jgi:peptide/nickel transport system ATP-binding protein
MSLLCLNHVDLAIHGFQVLRDVSLALDAGQTLGVIGESGSGKSMTANAIMGLLPSGTNTTGSITLSGEELLTKTEAELNTIRGRCIGMVFQEPMTALNPVQTIGDQVAETVGIHGAASRAEARQIARQTLDRVGLPADQFGLDRFPHELSGGQRQRVVIAMAIALRPALLIADEPTTALDVTTQAQILRLLRRLVDEDGMGLMLITHDLAVVGNMADHLAIMRMGEVVETGPTSDVFGAMQHPYTQALFAASSHVPAAVTPAAPIQQETILAVDGVRRDYRTKRPHLFAVPGRFAAVDGVTFTLKRGESVGLVGESGCGKSTLIRAILGLEPIQSGEIRLMGETLTTAKKKGQPVSRALRRRMQVVFQDPYGSFNPRHRVGRLIAEPFHLLDVPPTGTARKEAISAALAAVGLPTDAASRYIHEFSGGQRQRIAIARALILRPDLIILDEAVSALDVSIRAQVLDLLADLSACFGLTYLFISHDLGVVRSVTKRVLVMCAGQIVEHGLTEDVFAYPTHPYTQSLIDAAPRMSAVSRTAAS